MPNATAVWFKIAEHGRDANGKTWGDTELMTAGNAGYTYTIPECLKAGYYLVRHEIIALHDAASYPGAQFYPGCYQVRVSGGGNANPPTVRFPGAYSNSDPGIAVNIHVDLTTYKSARPAILLSTSSPDPTSFLSPGTYSLRNTSSDRRHHQVA